MAGSALFFCLTWMAPLGPVAPAPAQNKRFVRRPSRANVSLQVNDLWERRGRRFVRGQLAAHIRGRDPKPPGELFLGDAL